MPNVIYMTIETADGDNLSEGASSQESIGAFFKSGHEDEVFVTGFEHKVSVPTDRLTGQVTGNRKHEYLQIRKLIDKSSPLLFQCLAEPKSLNCALHFYRSADTGSDGQPVHYYTIELEGAKVVSIITTSPDFLDPANDSISAFEEVRFSYSSITWNHETASSTAIDNWAGE
ncbi:MAG: type VI secretion system tube protein Hcp [Marinospirillum sp.]|uniref:type VI secretion system tube protein TssD n=1 Tax=Marinospirillum sp. TaxID=2183934 RepID=UPI0019ED4CE4|nr:type VI secretion system tube protein TssD [Marinospirillum sp.]MBE0506348.1 type VI secretion system tube protein Hcp [Marinospirillum sp.]